MTTRGIVLSAADSATEARAAKIHLAVTIASGFPLVYDKTLFVTAGTKVPWDMLKAGWHFLDRWDAAAPLWKHGITGACVGSSAERKRTAKIIRDLRVPLYAHELLFVRKSEPGQALIKAFIKELGDGKGEPRLAFLRAFYKVKPRLCALPAVWRSDPGKRRQFTRSELRAAGGTRSRPKVKRRKPTPSRNQGRAMVTIEVTPGRLIQCYKGDEAQVIATFKKQNRRSSRRKKK